MNSRRELNTIDRDGNSSPNPGPDDQSRASRAVPGSEIGSTRDTEELEFTVEDPALFSEEEEETSALASEYVFTGTMFSHVSFRICRRPTLLGCCLE